MAAHNEFGLEGEDKAVNYLIREGYLILDRNWKSGHKELDIVAVLAADAYIRFNRIDLPVRFDIISIVSNSDIINHIEDAFRSPVWYR